MQAAATRQVSYPWADKAPAYSLNGLNSAARNNPGNGGDRFSLTYTAGAGDSTGAQAEWIQVIKANDATATEKMYGYNAGGGERVRDRGVRPTTRLAGTVMFFRSNRVRHHGSTPPPPGVAPAKNGLGESGQPRLLCATK